MHLMFSSSTPSPIIYFLRCNLKIYNNLICLNSLIIKINIINKIKLNIKAQPIITCAHNNLTFNLKEYFQIFNISNFKVCKNKSSSSNSRQRKNLLVKLQLTAVLQALTQIKEDQDRNKF
jgi:hypothetical protein